MQSPSDKNSLQRFWCRIEGVNIENVQILIPLSCSEFLFGRDPSLCDLTFRIDFHNINFDIYGQISRIHFSINKCGDCAYLLDHSLCGTYINGLLVGRKRLIGIRGIRLENGDKISMVAPDGPCLQFFQTMDCQPVAALPEQSYEDQIQVATQLMCNSSISDDGTHNQRLWSWGCLNGANLNLPTINLVNDEFSFGKSPFCDFRYLKKEHLIDPVVFEQICQNHFTIYKCHLSAYLVDSSKHGTYVNGVLVAKSGATAKILLYSGDYISVVSPSGPCFQFLMISKSNTLGIPIPVSLSSKCLVANTVLGSGATSSVFTAINLKTFEKCAIKVLDKKNPKEKDVNAFNFNINMVMQNVKSAEHKNIMSVPEIYEGEDHVFIAMEQMPGGSLISRIYNMLENCYMDEDSVRMIAHQVLLALQSLHYQNFTHGNIKPANILMVSNNKHDNRVKLADFGLSPIVTESRLAVTDPGNEIFKAPETRFRDGKALTSKADIWSLGATIHFCLCGNICSLEDVLDSSSEPNLMVDAPWDRISSEAKDCIQKMLRGDPEQRPCAPELLVHPWFVKGLLMGPSLLPDTPQQQPSGAGKSDRRPSVGARPSKPYSTKLNH